MPRKRTKPRNQKYCELTSVKGLIREKKDSYAKISKALDIAPNTFCRKINGEQIFDCVEMDIIIDRLEIDTEMIPYYFFPHRISGATIREYPSAKPTQNNATDQEITYGILRQASNLKSKTQNWVFETSEFRNYYEFSGEEFELITLLNDFYDEGYELVCSSEEGYIFKKFSI